ncbi:hypothetical protein V6N11_049762 [Hibiscus sabdariffa]|uniref:Uncharacterized protein n=1 Tax=Hibiscus sabdariffa TaxID=183260 RepID=A0ABR2T8E7_9ROSI
MEECHEDLDYYFHYGGRVCFVFCVYLTWSMVKEFHFGLRLVGLTARTLMIDCNNLDVVFMAKNNKSGSRSKHNDIKYLAIRERVKEKKVVIKHINIEQMLADPLTNGMQHT